MEKNCTCNYLNASKQQQCKQIVWTGPYPLWINLFFQVSHSQIILGIICSSWKKFILFWSLLMDKKLPDPLRGQKLRHSSGGENYSEKRQTSTNFWSQIIKGGWGSKFENTFFGGGGEFEMKILKIKRCWRAWPPT